MKSMLNMLDAMMNVSTSHVLKYVQITSKQSTKIEHFSSHVILSLTSLTGSYNINALTSDMLNMSDAMMNAQHICVLKYVLKITSKQST